MDGFRIREIRDVLTLEELKERVDTVDLLFNTIEVNMLYKFSQSESLTQTLCVIFAEFKS